MKNSCNVLYNGNIEDLTEKVVSFVFGKSEDARIFTDKFKSKDAPKKIRYDKTSADSQESVDASSQAFITDMNTVVQQYSRLLTSPKKKAKLLNLITAIENTFSIELDKTQKGSLVADNEESQQELKTETDVKDQNTTNLAEHLKEIYGTGAYDIIRSLKEDFDDATTAKAYWNINSGSVVLKSQTLLNKNFQDLKNQYFSTIVTYMRSKFPKYTAIPTSMVDENGQFIGSTYFDTMSSFYSYIKGMKDDFRSIIVSEQSDRINQTNRNIKTQLYQKLIQTLLQNKDFSELVGKNKQLTYNRRLEFENMLYEADHYSNYYDLAKKFIKKLKLETTKITIDGTEQTIQDILNTIEEPDKLTLLQAVNAYTCLTHFDELLMEMHGKSFEIAPALKGLEMAYMNKYSYHQDTSHEKKSWQQSEAVDSEKYIANMTRRVLNQIRIYDYKTNTYQNRRVDSTAFIVAARNLLNDVIYNNIIWSSNTAASGTRRRKKLDQFIQDALAVHSNPEEKFQLVLENLFGHPENDNSEPLFTSIESKKLLTDYDLNLLYSVYKAVYDKSNENSLISQELKNLKKGNGTIQNLVQEISGFVDRNTTMDYLETSYDLDSGEVVTEIKKKYFNNKELYKTRVGINHYVNSKTASESQYLKDLYNFTVLPTASKYVYYQATLGGVDITLKVPEELGGKILSNKDSISFTDTSLFEKINNIDLITFREKILSEATLDENETLLYSMLQFIDDHLGLSILANPSFGLQVLQSYKIIYNPITDKAVGKYYMMPLMQLAMRAAYANSRYAEAGDQSLKEYLSSLKNDDGIYRSYINNIKTSRLFSSKFNNVKYIVASSRDKVLDMWTDAQSMLIGDASKATTKDKQGNSIPNNSVNKLGSIINHYLLKQADSNVGSLLFVKDYTLIKGTYHDLEVTSWTNESKAIKAFSGGELFFHSIFNKFWGNYFKNGSVIIQPTTYADKTTFINYDISTKILNDGKDILQSSSYEHDVIEQYLNTLGTMYKNVWEETKNKLTAIATAYNKQNNTNYSFREVLQNLTEPELTALAKSLNIDLELDKDYRLIKKGDRKVAAVNEELEFYATKLYRNAETLSKALNAEKGNFVQNLLDSNSMFQVIDYNDDITHYLGGKISADANSKNPILKTILQLYANKAEERRAFFNDWVDARTGKLIIAKQNNNNIIGVGDVFNSEDEVILNPLLDKFFYVEGLLSNNLRMSLTGSEINHPNKAFGTSFQTLKNTSEENAEKVFNETIGNFDPDHSLKALKIIKELNYEGDLTDDFIKNLKTDSITKNILSQIYEQSLLTISNVSQGTQFKRNVIIPATLQYCQQGVKDGIPKKIKCAVIRDEQADVWNYRGDHEKSIDAADGSAWIDPFQSILENKSLGSQAVGFIKKPIWHSYDTSSGTAFLAKFATDTITNEAMRMSLASHTSLFNLFKKMTNLQWQGDVDLTESLMFGDLSDSATMYKWFQTTILGNTVISNENNQDEYIYDNHLVYQDAYGNNKEIRGFNKTKLSDGSSLYYTEESVIIGDISKGLQHKSTLADAKTIKVNKVYHVFHGDKHLTFDSYVKAKSYIDEHPATETDAGAHTINSLFELHAALGGLSCIDSSGKGSEFNNEVVVNFMNNIGHIKENRSKTSDLVNQDNYDQPLKNYHIGYALNNTAVKNGAKNINAKEAWYDDSELNYFEVDSDGLGMQMNADHDIVNSELTEFSQVITATSAYGYTHEQCNEIFQGLASAALQASKKALDSVDNFLKANFEGQDLAEAYSDLYDAIGRIILTNQSIKNTESLQHIIMEAVTKVFYKSKNHNNDSVKIPFSDANVYSDFIATLASVINKESIKRKHPGSGNVMAPGFNIIQYFEINGHKYMAPDILKMAQADFRQELVNHIKEFAQDKFNSKLNIVMIGGKPYNLGMNTAIPDLLKIAKLIDPEYTSAYEIENQNNTVIMKHLITTCLNKKQVDAPVYDDVSWFMPSDNVDIIDEEGNKLQTVELNSLDTYYKLKDGLFDIELNHNVRIVHDIKKQKYIIALKEDPSSMFILEREVNDIGKYTDTYNIHFKTGGFDSKYKRRTPWVGNKAEIEAKKQRLFRAAIEALPLGAELRLSPSTKEELTTGIGGLTKGSVSGFEKLFNIGVQDGNVELVKVSNDQNVPIEEEVGYFDKKRHIGHIKINRYKKIKQKKYAHRYRVNITSAHNLRPSLIRWQYYETDVKGLPLTDSEGNILPSKYMNIFDMDAVKNSYYNMDKDDSEVKTSREDIQTVLHNLHQGFFIGNNGKKYKIIEDSLENTAAELVMSNMHKEKFNIGNESLSEILDRGEDYFLSKAKKLNKPNNTNYDIAFLKDNGQNTLITFSNVIPNGYIQSIPFDTSSLATNEKDEIVLMKGNKELFEVGKWVDVDNVQYKDGKYYINNKLVENQEQYRLKDPNNFQSVQKQLIYLKKYHLTDTFTNKNGESIYKTNILYAISDISVFKEAFKSEKLTDEALLKSAEKQRGSIIRKIYQTDKFKAATIQSGIPYSKSKFNIIRSSLSNLLSNYYVPQTVKDLLEAELESQVTIDSFDKEQTSKYIYKFKLENPEKFQELLNKYLQPKEIEEVNKETTEKGIKQKITKYLNKNLFGDILDANKKKYKELEKAFLQAEAHKKWVSFQDSLKFISSRIPAQTLQSFMSMELVGWTENSKNMAYVSHFQTYLQGSDYDIDKAYIMSQSYDTNAVYIGWSKLFDFTSIKTLQASKALPVPKKVLIKLSNKGIDLNAEIHALIPLLNGGELQGDEQTRVKALHLITDILRKIENHTTSEDLVDDKSGKHTTQIMGYVKCDKVTPQIEQLINVLNSHEFYPISTNIAEQAYKNVASANIYAVAHDIRNRDQAYTAISMDILKRAAEKSPKGKSTSKLNMFNPLTKYVMQYQNLVGKNVISIAANAEKVWFNAFYHWNHILKYGTKEDIQRLKFSQTFNRIKGRAGQKLTEQLVTHLPDLNYRDEKIKGLLLAEFGANKESLEYKYVDQLISQLLSAATDNAKELILDKINAGTQFARMYVYAMMTGFSIDDIVAFMTSPMAQFIDRMSQSNIFQNESIHNNAASAIYLSKGIIGTSKFLHGTISVSDLDPSTNELTRYNQRKSTYVKNQILSNCSEDLLQEMHKIQGHVLQEDGNYQDFKGLGEVMQAYINVVISNNQYTRLDLSNYIDETDTEINTYIGYCSDIIEKLRNVYNEYDSYNDYKEDIEEFKKLYDLSTEVSSISSAWLGLNQGLPTDELSFLKRLISMSKLVYSREKALGLVDSELYEKPKNKIQQIEDDGWENVDKSERKTSEEKIKEIANNKRAALERIKSNNPTLEKIEDRLDAAHEAGLINGFDVVEYLKNNEYRQKVKDYYGLIMGTLNVFDMMETIPHYKQIIECFKTLVVSKNTLASKSRLIANLSRDYMDSNISDQQLKGIISMADKLNIKSFTETCDILSFNKPIEGFNAYFENIQTSRIDFSTLEGLSTFKHWMEHEFLTWAKQQRKTKTDPSNPKLLNPLYDNGVFKHLQIIPNDDRSLLSLDIDLLNPDVTSVSREGYDEILRGMADLEKIKFEDSNYTIADLFQLYNLIVNNNKYGGERFTTTFKVCTSPNNILNKYLKFVSEQDSHYTQIPEIDYIDYQISAAPIVNTFQEKYKTEPFIKVIDPVQGFILKRRTRNNTYEPYSLIPPSMDEESREQMLKRLENFSLYSPFEMPHTYNEQYLLRIIDFDQDLSTMAEEDINKLKNEIENILKKYSLSSKVFVIKDC